MPERTIITSKIVMSKKSKNAEKGDYISLFKNGKGKVVTPGSNDEHFDGIYCGNGKMMLRGSFIVKI